MDSEFARLAVEKELREQILCKLLNLQRLYLRAYIHKAQARAMYGADRPLGATFDVVVTKKSLYGTHVARVIVYDSPDSNTWKLVLSTRTKDNTKDALRALLITLQEKLGSKMGKNSLLDQSQRSCIVSN